MKNEEYTEKDIVNRSIDAKFDIKVSRDQMKVRINIYPPSKGGKFIDINNIYAEIERQSIINGVDKETIEEIVKNKLSGTYIIARGTEPISGKDAILKDMFSKNKTKVPTTRADGTTNYKNIDFFDFVHEGDVISTLVPPQNGVDGLDVKGQTIPAKKVKVYKLLKGKGTYISDDGLSLLAEYSGRLNFIHGSWNINKVLDIKSDVDNSTGNIDFKGDIIIKGDVQEGYSVTSQDGDVYIYGSVCCGSIYGNYVEISNGINGGGIGVIKSRGNIKTKFIENAEVYCEGNIVCQSILNSKVYCDGSITAKSGRGVIVGGVINAYNSIECKSVGTLGNVMTTINIGFNAKVFDEYKELLEQLKQLKIQLIRVEKNTKYIQEKLKDLEISEERRQILTREKKKRPINIFSQRNIIAKLKNIKLKYSNLSEDCYFECEMSNAPFEICFYNKFYIKGKESLSNVYAYVKDDELIVEKNNI